MQLFSGTRLKQTPVLFPKLIRSAIPNLPHTILYQTCISSQILIKNKANTGTIF